MTDLRVESADFKRLFGKSSAVDKKLKTALRRNIRNVGAEVVSAVRSAVGQSSGLRGRIAAGVQLKVMTGARAGVTIVASSSAMPPGAAPLVRGWEAQGGFRHPVFGNREVWVEQQGQPGFFRETVSSRRDDIRRAVEAAMTEAAASLKG